MIHIFDISLSHWRALALSLRLDVHVHRNTNVPDDSFHSPEQLRSKNLNNHVVDVIDLFRKPIQSMLSILVSILSVMMSVLYICVCMDALYPICMA